MTVPAGTRFGSYEVLAPIGAGGMGEVYRARDTNLNRDVAIKVLPALFASDPDRLARFDREAQALAALNHPHIAQIYGLVDLPPAGGGDRVRARALVMEFIDGEDLAGRLARGPIPLDEALAIARQIADALEGAHEAGIVHRDLKPANIKVRPDGTVKVLDFGLAKALEPAIAGTPLTLANSPTFTSAPLTAMGVLLGTAAYMAPEQARGKPVDKRADIWAFGCVLYEMLAGRPPFSGDTATDVLAAIISQEPDWSQLPAGLPAPLVRLLRRLLEKDLKRRLRDIGDARVELDPDPAGASLSGATGIAAPPARRRRLQAWGRTAALILLALALGTALGRWLPASPEARPAPVRFEITEPIDRARLAMAPDGSRVALVTGQGLVLRDLDRLETRALAGTHGADSPFWSDDSTTLAYGANGRLWRVPADGGAPSLITTLPDTGWDQDAGGAWLPDGSIVFTNGSSALLRVPATGGDAVTVLAPDRPEDLHFHHASALPGGRGVLFVTHRTAGADTIELWAGGERRQLLRLEGSTLERPVYSPTGHLLFTRFPTNFGLWAVPFSLDRLEITGEPVLVIAGAVTPSISRTARLAYLPVSGPPPGRLTWIDRRGERLGRLDELGPFDGWVALSPDGTRAAVVRREGGRQDIWAYDLNGGGGTQLTSDGFARLPQWSPDGKSVIYASVAPDRPAVIRRASADGSGILDEVGPGIEPAVSGDGQRVFYSRGFSLFHRPLAGGDETVLLKDSGRYRSPQPSPDGRLIAYTVAEDASLRRFLVVSSMPAFALRATAGRPPGAARAVIDEAGRNLRWIGDGRRLVFTNDTDVLEVDVQTEPRLRLGVPRRLFSLGRIGASGVAPAFDVSADGQRFVFVEPDAAAATPRAVVVLDFAPDR
jgi:eukaryotic-like serine/threonine-protein kinase